MEGIELTGNGEGILIADSERVTVAGVTLRDHDEGIHMVRAADCLVTDFSVRQSRLRGIYLWDSHGNLSGTAG